MIEQASRIFDILFRQFYQFIYILMIYFVLFSSFFLSYFSNIHLMKGQMRS